MEVEQGAVTTKGVVRPLSTRGVWGHGPLEKFQIRRLEISSILGIKRSVVYDNF